MQGRVGLGGQHVEQREVGERRDQAAAEDDRLAADPVREAAEEQEAAGGQNQRPSDHDVGRELIDLQDALQEEQRVELAGVPNHGLTGGKAEQGQQRPLGVLPLTEGFRERRLGVGALLLHLLEGWALLHLQADPDRDGEQHHRDEERNAPAPDLEGRQRGRGPVRVGHRGRRIGAVHVALRREDDDQREQQAERRGGLNEGGIEAAPSRRSVFGHVDRRAAVLAAERETLEHAQRQQRHRRNPADIVGREGRIGGQKADREGRDAHDQDGDEEGVLTTDHVAEPAEHQCAERAHKEACGEGQQCEDVAGRLRVCGEELRADDRGERAV